MSSFDPMAAALDWFDAYRARDIAIIDLYASDAALECNCKSRAMIIGRTALHKYWRNRFDEKPAGALAELNTDGGSIVVSYSTPDGVVRAALKFNDQGKIIQSICGPLKL